MKSSKLKIKDIRIDAVIVGAIVDNVGTLFVMMLLMTSLASTGISQDEVMLRMKGLSGLLLTLIIGLGGTFLGGYVAGRMAKQSEILHGGFVAAVGIAIGVAFGEETLPLWYHIVGFGLMLPAGMFGGRLALLRRPAQGQ